MKYDVQFSLEAASEFVRIAASFGSAVSALKAVEANRRKLEVSPADQGVFLSEGLFYIDEDPVRAFYLIDAALNVVEVTDFRIL